MPTEAAKLERGLLSSALAKLTPRFRNAMRGRRIPLSVPRRIIADLMRVTASVPTIPIVRQMNLDAVVKARAANSGRPPWSAIFVKAFAVVAEEMPVLRRTYVKYPWAHLYEYPTSNAVVAVERRVRRRARCVIRHHQEPKRAGT